MIELIVKSTNAKQAVPVLESAIRNQLKLIKMSIIRTNNILKQFEQKYNMTTEEFLKKIKDGMDEDNLDYIDWIGENKILKRLEEEYRELQEVKFC